MSVMLHQEVPELRGESQVQSHVGDDTAKRNVSAIHVSMRAAAASFRVVFFRLTPKAPEPQSRNPTHQTTSSVSSSSQQHHTPRWLSFLSTMSSPFSSDIAKPQGSTAQFARDVTAQTDRKVEELKQKTGLSMPIPAYGDLGKAANDVGHHRIAATA